jgi:leader peptidase (prepilin peptidase) / N-methyltransferase
VEKIILIPFGLIIGSFLNVVIHRLPLKKSIVTPGSRCPVCLEPIRYFDNIPLLSYLILRGRCRHCQTRIPAIYPVVEALTAGLFYLCGLYLAGDYLYLCMALVFTCILVALAFIDGLHMILPLELTIGGALVFAVYAFFNPAVPVVDAYLSSLGGALVFAGLYFFYLKVRKIEGLGQGDIFMMLLLGMFLGIRHLAIALLIASLSGMCVGMFFILFRGKNMKFALPFGTFLSLGSLVSLFWGTDLLALIAKLFPLQ